MCFSWNNPDEKLGNTEDLNRIGKQWLGSLISFQQTSLLIPPNLKSNMEKSRFNTIIRM